MSSSVRTERESVSGRELFAEIDPQFTDLAEAEAVLLDLARVFSDTALDPAALLDAFLETGKSAADAPAPNLEAKYRALLEQIPAVVFMAYLDRGISEAYVSPQI
jgi:hypothetical protein